MLLKCGYLFVNIDNCKHDDQSAVDNMMVEYFVVFVLKSTAFINALHVRGLGILAHHIAVIVSVDSQLIGFIAMPL